MASETFLERLDAIRTRVDDRGPDDSDSWTVADRIWLLEQLEALTTCATCGKRIDPNGAEARLYCSILCTRNA